MEEEILGGDITPGNVLESLSTWQIPDINNLEVGTVSLGPWCQRIWSVASGARVSGPAVQTSFMEKHVMEECWSVPGSQETAVRGRNGFLLPIIPSEPHNQLDSALHTWVGSSLPPAHFSI